MSFKARAQTWAGALAWSHAPLSPLEVLQVERGNSLLHPALISTAIYQIGLIYGFKKHIAFVYLINHFIRNLTVVLIDFELYSQTNTCVPLVCIFCLEGFFLLQKDINVQFCTLKV